MKSLIAGSIVLVASAAGVYAAEAPAGSCQALVAQGSCVYAAALEGGEAGRIGTVSQIEGRVMSSGENGFTPAKSDTSLMIGDRILVLEGGKATLQAGAFTQALSSPSVIDASAREGCGCLTVQSDVRTFAQAAGAAAGAGAAGAGAGGGAGAGALGGVAGALGVSTTAVAVGGAVAVGAAAVGIGVAASNNNNDDTPTSP